MEKVELKEIILNNVMYTSEVIAMLGISRQRLHVLVKDGKLVPIKVKPSESSLFLKEDIENFKRKEK